MYGQMQQERERVREEGERRENVGEEKKRKKIKVREEAKTNAAFFHGLGAPGDRKVGWQQRRVRSDLVE